MNRSWHTWSLPEASLRALLLAVMVAVPIACTSPFGTGDEDRERIRAQRAIWEAQAVDDYTFETRQVCFCAYVEWLEVTVQADTVVLIASADGSDVPIWLQENYPTVDGLFDVLERAVDQDAVQIDVTWHETMGYPVTFYIDYARNIADEELGHDIRLLTPTP